MAKNLIDLGDRVGAHGMENPEEVLEPKELEVSQTIASEQSVTLKNKRSVVKRKITIHLKALSSEIEQFGSKFRIRRIIADLKQCLQEAELLNVQYLAFTPEIEHDKILEWYDVEFGRVNDALDEALTHLNERESEETSQATSVSRRSKVFSKSDPVVIKAKAAAAQAFAKKQRESAKEKLRELERQAELQKKLWKAKEEVERVKMEAELELEKQRSMSDEAQKTRQIEAEAIRLEVEAEVLENEAGDPDSLQQRLKDFEGEEIIPVSPKEEIAKEVKPVHVPENSMAFVGARMSTSTPKQGMTHQPLKVKFQDKETVSNEGLHVETPANTIILRSSVDSLPKLKLDSFDGDPIRWSDWMSMFQSIIDDADISRNAKMQHLQNAVIGRAKEAIEGYGYSRELYAEALEKLESRFGKSHVVVKAHLNRLRKWVKLSDDRLHEVRRFSDVISTAVKTFKRLGYTNDLHAANNLNMVVDKLPYSLRVKWKEYRREKELKHATLLDFEKWIEMQAEVHDDFGIRTSKPPLVPPDHKLKHRGGSAVYSAVTAPSGGSPRFNQSGQFTSPPYVLGDGKCHKLHSCPKFKELSVVERLAKVKEHGLCFRCFGRHWANKCRCTKQCGVNGCTRLHHELLHRTIDENRPLSIPTPEEPPIQHSQPEPLVEGSHVMQATPNKSRVLLQVVPVTLYGPCGQLNAHALLDSGSTCSLIRGDVADQLDLDGPPTSLDLFGIQVTSHLKTKRVSFNIGPVDEDSTRYLVENALVAERLNVPPTSVNTANVQSQWKHFS